MKQHSSSTSTDWLPLAKSSGPAGALPTGEAFRPEWIDFARGIRVGNFEPHKRITQCELVRAITRVFAEVVPAMNAGMQVRLAGNVAPR